MERLNRTGVQSAAHVRSCIFPAARCPGGKSLVGCSTMAGESRLGFKLCRGIYRNVKRQDHRVTASAASRAVRTKSKSRRPARGTDDLQDYFAAVAQVRYIMRKVFRMVDDDAKKLG